MLAHSDTPKNSQDTSLFNFNYSIENLKKNSDISIKVSIFKPYPSNNNLSSSNSSPSLRASANKLSKSLTS